MGKVNTNDIELNYAREATPGVLPAQPAWRTLEPNNIPVFGNEYKTTARNPISKDRQRRKGAVTDMDSPLELEGDFTLSHFRDFIEAFCYCNAVGPEAYDAGNATGTGYTVAALTAAQAGRMIYSAAGAKTLVYARGYAKAANNGLKPLNAAVNTNGTEVKVAGNAVEVAPTDTVVEVAIAGIRGKAADLEIDANGDLISTELDFTTLGLSAGQSIYIGGDAAANQFAQAANSGFARIESIAANKIELNRRKQDFVVDNGAGKSIDILFGQFVRNVAVDHADYAQITNQMEMASPNLADNGDTLYDYSTGNYADAMVVGLPLTEKATIKFGFVGLDTKDPVAARATNADAAKGGVQLGAFGTASDLARLRVLDADETGLSTDFKSLTMNLKNNMAGEKVLGKLGPKYVNAGNLEIDVEFEAIFTNADVITRIRNNGTIGLDFALHNGDGAAYIDFPSGTLEGGKRNFKENESVTINATFMAHKDATLGTSLGVSLFPYVPE